MQYYYLFKVLIIIYFLSEKIDFNDLFLWYLCLLFFFCYFPEVYSASLEQGVVCIPDAVDLLLSLTGFLNVSIGTTSAVAHL